MAVENPFSVWGQRGPSRGRARSPGRGRWEHPSARVIDLAAEADTSVPGSQGKVRVLLVEDDQLFAKLVANILQEVGSDFVVEHVPSLGSALACLVRDHIDLILTDLNLPDSAGPATVGFLRSVAPDIPIVVLSGADDVQVAVEVIREGADEYIVKSRFSIDSLVWLVRLVLERHRRFVVGGDSGFTHPASGLASLSALRVVGRQFLRVADRTGLHAGVVLLEIKAASRGEWADWERLLVAVCDLLQGTLRGCDLVSRLPRGELAVLLVSEGPLGGAVDRLKEALADAGVGPHFHVGFAAYDSQNRSTLDHLLEQARSSAHAVLT